MTKIQGLSKEDEKFIINTVKKFFPDSEIILFGSRYNGIPKKYSDIDLCIKSAKALDLGKWSQMEEAFADSLLPFMVDVSDFHLLTEDFRKHVLKTGTQI